MHQSSLTGRDVREMEPAPHRDMLLEQYAEAVGLAAPTLYLIKQNRGDLWNEYRRIILPLGTPDGTVERLLAASAWEAGFVERARQLGFADR